MQVTKNEGNNTKIPNNNISLLKVKLDEKPPLSKSIVLAFQSIFACFSGIVAVPLVVAGALKLDFQTTSFLVACALFASGVTSFVQAKGIGPVGSKLPFIMGTSFSFVSTAIAVGAGYVDNPKLGLGVICTATIVAALLEVVLSGFIPMVRKLFPTVVTGLVVTTIGITIIPVGIDWLAGGSGAADYGNPKYLLVGFIVLAIILITNHSKNKYVSASSVFIGIVCGYFISIPFGMLDLSQIKDAAWFSIPQPMKYGFHLSWPAVISFIAVYLASMVETIGDTLAIGEACETEISDKRLGHGVLCDALGSVFAGIFNTTANTSFSQCTGLVNVTGVASRFVTMIAAVLLVIMGLIPKFAALVSIMPSPVLGAAGIVMFGSISCSGIKILAGIRMTKRNTFIIGISFALAVGVLCRPASLQCLPSALQTILGSGVTIATLSGVILNIVLPKGVGDE